ncbi:MAG: serine protease Do [Verrucomicrobiales bacterium]|jgi:serine protease Do
MTKSLIPLALAVLGCSTMSHAQDEAAAAAPQKLGPPTEERDLLAVQSQLLKVLDRAKAATVGVESDGSGSGVIITSDGYVLTAAHVSGKPGLELFIVLPDGRRVKAKSLGNKTFADAGLIKIMEPGEYPTAVMAESGESMPGDWCFALGHPGGFDEDRGVVLRVGRIIRRRTDTIQSDCKLLGGDSGGPLFDMQGRVIGIHSRIGSGEDENFHVTVRAFHRDWEKMVAGEYLREKSPAFVRMGGYLGVVSASTVRGVTITRVERRSPAASAGLRAGDIVSHIDGEKVETRNAFRTSVAGRAPKDEINFTILRRGAEKQIQVTLGRRPES